MCATSDQVPSKRLDHWYILVKKNVVSARIIMATTWNVIRAEIVGTMKYIALQEVIDGVEGKTYSCKMHEDSPNSEMREKLKVQIDINRAIRPDNIAFRATVEAAALTFEDYLTG